MYIIITENIKDKIDRYFVSTEEGNDKHDRRK